MQIVLADEATKMLHGEFCLPQIHQTIQQIFAGGAGGSNAALPRYPWIVDRFVKGFWRCTRKYTTP